jgi:hypothetical protein
VAGRRLEHAPLELSEDRTVDATIQKTSRPRETADPILPVTVPITADPGEEGKTGTDIAMGAEGVAGDGQVEINRTHQLMPLTSGQVVGEFELRQPAANGMPLEALPHMLQTLRRCSTR